MSSLCCVRQFVRAMSLVMTIAVLTAFCLCLSSAAFADPQPCSGSLPPGGSRPLIFWSMVPAPWSESPARSAVYVFHNVNIVAGVTDVRGHPHRFSRRIHHCRERWKAQGRHRLAPHRHESADHGRGGSEGQNLPLGTQHRSWSTLLRSAMWRSQRSLVVEYHVDDAHGANAEEYGLHSGQ